MNEEIKNKEELEKELEENKEVTMEDEIVGELPPFITFLVGLRENPAYEVKTNVVGANVGDFANAIAAIELNTILQIFKVGGLEEVDKYQRVKEIMLIQAARLLPDEGNGVLTKEDVETIKKYFRIDVVEQQLEEIKRAEAEKKQAIDNKKTNKKEFKVVNLEDL